MTTNLMPEIQQTEVWNKEPCCMNNGTVEDWKLTRRVIRGFWKPGDDWSKPPPETHEYDETIARCLREKDIDSILRDHLIGESHRNGGMIR